MTWVVPRQSHSFDAVLLERVCSWLCGLLSLLLLYRVVGTDNHSGGGSPHTSRGTLLLPGFAGPDTSCDDFGR
jgi:hypothetical protein